MPSIAEAPLSPLLSNGSGNWRKRRWEAGGDAEGDGMKLSSPHQRRSITEIISPVRRHSQEPVNNGMSPEMQFKRAMALDRAKHDSKRQRIPSVFEDEADIQMVPPHVDYEPRDLMMDIDVENRDEGVALGTGKGYGDGKVVDLSPCHICRRKPSAKHELDQFSGCERCGERTCYVCIRQCLGMGLELEQEPVPVPGLVHRADRVGEKKGPVWHHSTNGLLEEDMLDYVPLRAEAERDKEKEGHRERVCSRCCRERGVDGEVWCLGCLEMATRR